MPVASRHPTRCLLRLPLKAPQQALRQEPAVLPGRAPRHPEPLAVAPLQLARPPSRTKRLSPAAALLAAQAPVLSLAPAEPAPQELVPADRPVGQAAPAGAGPLCSTA